jgi:hypothetical protein
MCKVERMRNMLGVLGIVISAVAGMSGSGCGDNSRACGPGTVEDNGYCVPGATCGFGTRPDENTGECVPDGTVVCSGGTVFDPLTGSCEIDENACQAGTVLIANACVDPSAGLVVDVQEGPEPNGLGLIEMSPAQAGNIVLKPNEPFVIHGTIAPHRDFDGNGVIDPDVDTYVLQIGAPTFLRVTADGLGGLAGGFIAIADVDAADVLADWQRIGMSLVSDTSVREIFLPRAGKYRISIADTRTLVDQVTGSGALASPGSASAEYYVSLTPFDQPTPTVLPLTNGQLSTTRTKPSDQVAVLGVQLGTGLNHIELTTPSALTVGAFVVRRNGMLASIVDETSGPAQALIGDIEAGDETVIVVDDVYTLLPSAVTYTLDVTASNAALLSTSGATVTAPATTNTGADFANLNLFAFDVPTENATIGFQLMWSPAIVGQIYNALGVPVAAFTNPSTMTTWTDFRGLVRFPQAGRYYFAVYAPSATSSSSLSVTSTIAELAVPPVTQGTPQTSSIGTFRARAFTYDVGAAGSDAWHQLDVTGSNTGGQQVSWYAPGAAFGRLDSLSTSSGTLPPEVVPLFTHSYTTAGGAIGRVVLDDPRPYYVKVNATSPTTSPTATLAFARREAMVDLGTVATGTIVTRTGETIDPSTPERFFVVRAPVGAMVTITITPTSSLNTQFRRVKADETALGALINTSSGGADVETFQQTGSWTAFVVSAAGPLNSSRTFDVTVQLQ